MGGGQKVKQTNPVQAAAANAGATSTAKTAQGLGDKYSGQQQQLWNQLFGTPGQVGGVSAPGGALGGFLDPASLNVTSPTGVYKTQNVNADTAAASQAAANSANIKANAAQSGFGANTPTGFVADQQAKNAQALAGQRGTNFSTAASNQYQDALKNFWNAGQMAQTGAETGQQGALAGTGTAAQVYSNLYGTAGKGNVISDPNYLSPILGAAGTIGSAAMGPGGVAANAAACAAEGTLIETDKQIFKPIEELRVGDRVLGVDGRFNRLERPPEVYERDCVEVSAGAKRVIVSTTHAFLAAAGGWIRAGDAEGELVRTANGEERVSHVEPAGTRRVVRLLLDGSHSYRTNGIFSEE
jgi:hypothetical protein